jgi:hypothetical protein
MQGVVFASEPDILEALDVLGDAVEAEYSSEVEKVRLDMLDIVDARELEKDVNIGNWFSCNGDCTGGDDECEAACMRALCQAESAQHPAYASALSGNAADFDAVRMEETAAYLFEVAEVRDDYSDADDTELMYFEMLVGADLFEKTSSIDANFVMVKAAIDTNKRYVEQTCTAAEYLEQLAAAKAAMANQASPFDVCLDGVFCVGLQGDRLTIGVQVGFVSADLAVNTSSGDYTLGLGVGVTDPTGTLDVSVGLKYDSEKGGGIGGDFKFGGPVKLKYSRDVYFLN